MISKDGKEPSLVATIDRDQSLAGLIWRELGDNAISIEPDPNHANHRQPAKDGWGQDTVQQLHRERQDTPPLHQSGQEFGEIRQEQRMDGPRGLLDTPQKKRTKRHKQPEHNHDGIRENITRRLQATVERAREAAKKLSDITSEFTANVRAYFTREQAVKSRDRTLEQAGHKLERE